MRHVAAIFVLLLAWCATPAHAGTWTPASAVTSCTTNVTSCTANINTSVPVGSTLVVVATVGSTNSATGATVSDNASTPNCGGAYSPKPVSYASSTTSALVAVCGATTSAMTSGTTCGAGGTTQCSIIITTLSVAYYQIQVFLVSGLNTSAVFDKTGTVTGGQWTSGSANTFATTPVLGYSSVDALVLVASYSGGSADTMTTYGGGFTAISSAPAGAANRPEFFLSHQTITSGTATMTATPTSTAGRYFLSASFLFVNSGAVSLGGNTRPLLGVGQ